MNSPNLESKPGIAARRTPRRVFNRPIGILYHGEYTPVRAWQISEGGLLFSSPQKLVIHTSIVLTVLVPGAPGIVARGELIYQKPQPGNKIGDPQFGVKFENLPLHLRRVIRNYVSAKTQAEAEMEADDL
jgi:hypothetical protein